MGTPDIFSYLVIYCVVNFVYSEQVMGNSSTSDGAAVISNIGAQMIEKKA